MNLFHVSLTALAVALSLPAAQAATFGGLNITPRGPQTLNLDTGATDMPQGGTVTDQQAGLKLVAARIQLQPGQSLRAQEAVLTTRQGGTLRASQVVYDLNTGTVTASGQVSYSDARLSAVKATQMTLFVRTGFVRASGNLQASRPALKARALTFDSQTMQVLLEGPYSLTAGGRTQSAGAGTRLLLAFAGQTLTRAAAPDGATLARFAPYLK